MKKNQSDISSKEDYFRKYFESLERKKGQLKKIRKIGKILLFGEINDETVANTIASLEEAKELGFKAIDLVICSEGGFIDYGNALIDYVIHFPLPIITTSYGGVSSMAVVIFQLGIIRRMTPLSILTIHHSQGAPEGTAEKLINESEIIKYQDEMLFALMAIRSKIPLKKLKKMAYPLLRLTAEEAVKMNLADVII
jgi:ATP-dependent protease ClpP protease subunit